jgi:multiple sugar transport system ATP-binding protein
LSNLDAKLRASMRVEIARLHRSLDTTMIYVTHDQVEAMTLGDRIVVLDKGAIQQIDTPQNLYERPATMFVAGFLGSPAMNFFRGRIIDDGGNLRLDGGATQLPLPRRNGVDFSTLAGREVVVGIRPEDLLPIDGIGTGDAQIDTVLEVAEPVGNETFLNLRFGDRVLVMRSPSRSAPPAGASIAIGYRAEWLHAFDPTSERRIEFPARA